MQYYIQNAKSYAILYTKCKIVCRNVCKALHMSFAYDFALKAEHLVKFKTLCS